MQVEYVTGRANVLADFVSRVPLQRLAGLLDAAAFDLSREIPPTASVFAALEEWREDFNRRLNEKKCPVCRLHEGEFVVCDRCGEAWHLSCAGLPELPK